METRKNNVPTTQDKLHELMQQRNDLLTKGFSVQDLDAINTELVTTLAQIATYKTLKFLMSNNATVSTETEATDNGQNNSFGFDMSVKLLSTLPKDIKTLQAQLTDNETLTDAIDLVQVASEKLIPFICSTLVFNLSDTVYTKTLKNGNEKSYSVFALACKGIREYITSQQQTRQYKKQAYIIGYTDNGTEILTTKRPKNDITDISTHNKVQFLKRYNLTSQEQTALFNLLKGKTTTEIADYMQVSKRTIERAIKSGKEKIQAIDKRIVLGGKK